MVTTRETSSRLVGSDPAFLRVLETAERAAVLDVPVLIYGETGTGKGGVAEHIHRLSSRDGRFVSLNCATFQSSLFESELFGYMKGAFTGADKDTPGLFEAASGGTLFLDEIGDTPPEIQPKLLRAVEQGVIRRVGGRDEIAVDVRLVCATNKDLQELIRQKKFREDLFYRINSFVITVPPLRERPEDIAALANHFLREIVPKGRTPPAISGKAMKLLQRCRWPGNVRELRSAIQHACAQAGAAAELLPEHLPPAVIEPGRHVLFTPEHHKLFRELDAHGGADPVLWARFLLELARYTGDDHFSRGHVLECLRACRGDEATDHSLANEWQRHVKPTGLKLGLIVEEGKKLAISQDACEALLQQTPAPSPVERHQTPLPVTAPRKNTNVAGARTSFVGRGVELADLCKTLRETKHNLVTITGPGGMGKTRLAREIARTLADKFPGGAWFVDLVEARDVEGVSSAVAQALGVPLNSDQPAEQFIASLLEMRRPILLILDNFEQVVHAAPETVGQWAERAPHVRFLVTSRAMLGLEGESGFDLNALPCPTPADAIESIARNEAVRLFVERARLQHASFTLTSSSAAAVAAVCARLEGIPLAIELAAARIAVLQPEEILSWLDKLLPLLQTDRRDVTPRHRSLQAAIDWSFQLLDETEQRAFMQLSVFSGGFFLEAATAVLELAPGKEEDAPLATLNVIQSLYRNSLLRAEDTPYGTRYAMYVAIHEYVHKQWRERATPEEQEALNGRHARQYRDYVKHWNYQRHGSHIVEVLNRLDFERANVKAAMDWAEASADGAQGRECRELYADLAAYVTPTLILMRGPIARHIPLLHRAMELLDPDRHVQRATLMTLLGVAEKLGGAFASARSALHRALQYAEAHGVEPMIAWSVHHLASTSAGLNQHEEALQLDRKALTMFEKLGLHAGIHSCRTSIGKTLNDLGRANEALAELDSNERTVRDERGIHGLGFLLLVRSYVHLSRGDEKRALADSLESEGLSRELEDRRMTSQVLYSRQFILRGMRRLHEIEPLLKEAEQLALDAGNLNGVAYCTDSFAHLYLDLDRWDDARQSLERVFHLPVPPVELQTIAVSRALNGLIYALTGNTQEGEREVRRAIELLPPESRRPERAAVLVRLPEVLHLAGKHEEALAEVDKVQCTLKELARNADSFTEGHFRCLVARCSALRALGREAEALESARQARELATKLNYALEDPSPRIRRDMALLYEMAGA